MDSGPSGPHGVPCSHLHRGAVDCALLQPVLKSLADRVTSLSVTIHFSVREDASPALVGRGMDLLSGPGLLGSTISSLFGLFERMKSFSFSAFARVFHKYESAKRAFSEDSQMTLLPSFLFSYSFLPSLPPFLHPFFPFFIFLK